MKTKPELDGRHWKASQNYIHFAEMIFSNSEM